MTWTSGWKLDRGDRERLLSLMAPRYDCVVADHVTLRSGVQTGASPPPEAAARIVGAADDGLGVQAMIVEIDGTSARPDGGTFHITWSLGDGREAKESNDVLAAQGWTPLREPLAVELRPALWPRGG